MKKIILLGMMIMTLPLYSQKNENKMSGGDWDKIIQLLTSEKWDDAEKTSLKFLNKFDKNDDSSSEPAILRYMYLSCVAAKVGEKIYSKEEGEKKAKKLIGKHIITPPREFNEKRIFNGFKLTEDKKSFWSCSSNNTMTIIRIFETYEMRDSNDTKNTFLLENKKIRLGATIKEVRSEGQTMPRLHITFENAFFWED
ncbi:MAG: hypothetical protein NTX03_13895 [Bacteroidetes bacterium]|nr:hypothetical protein [Bacteroidota bacterium]